MFNAQRLKILYNVIVYSSIIFFASVWEGTYKSIMSPGFIAQKSIIRAILGVRQRTKTGGFFQELGYWNKNTFWNIWQ